MLKIMYDRSAEPGCRDYDPAAFGAAGGLPVAGPGVGAAPVGGVGLTGIGACGPIGGTCDLGRPGRGVTGVVRGPAGAVAGGACSASGAARARCSKLGTNTQLPAMHKSKKTAVRPTVIQVS